MLRIRLQRIGRKKKPNYRIVVAEHSSAVVKNKYVEQLGYYNPLASEKVFEVNTEKLLEWIKKGAKPTNTIARLLKQDGVKDMEPFIIEMKDRQKKKKKEPKAEGAPTGEGEEAKPAEGEGETKPEEKPVEEAPAKPAPEAPAEEKKEKEKPAEEPVEEVKKEFEAPDKEEKKEEEPK